MKPSKMSSQQLLIEFEHIRKHLATTTDTSLDAKIKLRREILWRLACYQFAIKPLNKKLYRKIVVKI
jgi:hypothetical protein